MDAVQAEQPTYQELGRQRLVAHHEAVLVDVGDDRMDVDHGEPMDGRDLGDRLVVGGDGRARDHLLARVQDDASGERHARASHVDGDPVAPEDPLDRVEGDEIVRRQRSVGAQERHRLAAGPHHPAQLEGRRRTADNE